MLGISKHFGGVRALNNVDFSIRPGEVHCLAGENGCGKSTLIKILAGVYAPDGGEIMVDGQAHAHLTPAASQRAGVQIIYQDLSLFPNLSVAENIVFRRHLEHPGRVVRWRGIAAQAKGVMSRLGVDLPLGEAVGRLPIAARQLVAILRALAAEARLVVMDEPTASLTHHEIDALLQNVDVLKGHGIATVFVSHKLEEVMRIAERVTVLRDGQKVGTFAAGEIDRYHLSELMTGHKYTSSLKPAYSGTADPILEVHGLTRRGQYEGVSMAVRPGEILGITGRLGSGRTELALSLFGMNPPDSGEIRVKGKPVRLKTNRAAVRAGIGYVSEDRLSLGLVMPQSIADNIVVSVLNKLTGPLGLIDGARRRNTIDQWLGELHIRTKSADQPVQQLSGGNQQRVVLAKWLATSPSILILDSPTVGVDVGAKDGIYQIIAGLAGRGMAIILISDEVEEVLHQSHRILVMLGGQITASFHPATVTEKELREVISA
ncbi:MAG: sugar ABC transporter ATP-binding protein [Verrucomicrobia bacterium]|nr:sugar ABC transporter ATP-binding protein [Verrucomicrobiota bacterium]MBV9273644.1 sugar ABC transporter ATP-binding protein [Verrucomicrobiota bacterium]